MLRLSVIFAQVSLLTGPLHACSLTLDRYVLTRLRATVAVSTAVLMGDSASALPGGERGGRSYDIRPPLDPDGCCCYPDTRRGHSYSMPLAGIGYASLATWASVYSVLVLGGVYAVSEVVCDDNWGTDGCALDVTVFQLAVVSAPAVLYLLPLPSIAGCRRRLNILRRLGDCLGAAVGAPILGGFEVKLVHTLIADALTSSCILLWDLEITVCTIAFPAPLNGTDAVNGFDGDGDGADMCGGHSWNTKSVTPFFFFFLSFFNFG